MRTQSKWKQAAIAVFCLVLVSGAAPATAGIPTDQIKATVDKAIVVLKDPRYKGEAKTKERRDELKKILFTRFDFAEMAKRSLGAHWRKRSEAEQKEFVNLFTDLLERAYADIIESYSDEKVVYLNERLDGSFVEVVSKIQTAKGQEYSINYKAQQIGSEWRVYDLVAENISLVSNYRSQFDRVINKKSYEELVRLLKSKADFGGAPKK
ncbi:MAG: ABC transporter substrate-binding protein [Deltaproteobacteria bacterium]|nr:ABC transporter substrate-binding protein [Deltaproteobacteria bacterium]